MQHVGGIFDFLTDPRAAKLPAQMPRRLVVSVAAALVLSVATAAAIVALLQLADWWSGLLAAAVVSLLGAVLSLVPLLWGIRRNLNATVVGYFVAMAIRAVVSLGVASLAVFVGHYPAMATLLLTAFFYVAMLAVEATVVAGAAWNAAKLAESADPAPTANA